MAQLKHFTLEDVIPGGNNYKNLQPENMHLSWWGNQLMRLEKTTCSMYGKDGKWSALFTLDDVKPLCDEVQSLETISFNKATEPVACFSNAKVYLEYNWKDKKIFVETYRIFA